MTNSTSDQTGANDFDFVIGNWKVRHRRLKERLVGCTDWLEFEGTSRTQQIFGGQGNLEDNFLAFPDAPYRDAALRFIRLSKWAMVDLVAGPTQPISIRHACRWFLFEWPGTLLRGRQSGWQGDQDSVYMASQEPSPRPLGAGLFGRRGEHVGDKLDHGIFQDRRLKLASRNSLATYARAIAGIKLSSWKSQKQLRCLHIRDLGRSRPVRPTSASAAPDQVARNENYWSSIRSLFDLDLNMFGSPTGREERFPKRFLIAIRVLWARCRRARPGTSRGPWHQRNGSSQALRQRMAKTFGCESSEIALTRNAMEGLANCLLGYDLRRGDEVITTQLDYDACISILRQRERREGIRVKVITIPVPALNGNDVVSAFEKAIGPNTRMILACHMTTGNGQILPIADIGRLARRKNIFFVVDGAHTPGHLDFRIKDLECDAFAGSLHKWFMAPRGTGLLYIRNERIKDVWPIWAPDTELPDNSIEKCEAVGTTQLAGPAVLPLVFRFQESIGIVNKEARLRYLRDRSANPLRQHGRLKFLTDFDPTRSCAITSFQVLGTDPVELKRTLRKKYQLRVRSFREQEQPSISGVNVGASLTNSVEEVERLAEAIINEIKAT